MRMTEAMGSVVTSSHTHALIADAILINGAIHAQNEGKPFFWHAAGAVVVTGLELANLYREKKRLYANRSWESVREKAENVALTPDTAANIYATAIVTAASDRTPIDTGNYHLSTLYRSTYARPRRNETEIAIKSESADTRLPDILITDRLRNETDLFEISKSTDATGGEMYTVNRITYVDEQRFNHTLGKEYTVAKSKKIAHPLTEAEGKRLAERLSQQIRSHKGQ